MAVWPLDVSIRAQVLNLFMELRAALNLTYLFTSHDLSAGAASRIAGGHDGRWKPVLPKPWFNAPNHPYTKALLAELPFAWRSAARIRDGHGRNSVAESTHGLSFPSALSGMPWPAVRLSGRDFYPWGARVSPRATSSREADNMHSVVLAIDCLFSRRICPCDL